MKNLKLRLIVLTIAVLMIVSGAAAQESSKSFSVKKGGSLEVNVSGGDVILKSWEKDEVYINSIGIKGRELEDLKMSQSGNTVVLTFKPGGGHSGNVKFEISLPNQFDTDIKTSGGDVIYKGSISGLLKAKTSGGDIKLENLGGKIEMTTSGGDITSENIDGEGTLKTAGGDIKLGIVSGTLKVNTAGGDIIVKNVGKSLKASTAGGDIEIGDIGGEASASTAGGDIRVGKVAGKATLSTAGGDIDLKGATGSVSAKTAGGDLRLYNIYGAIEGKTSGGDITAEILATGNGGSTLKTAGGKIALSISPNAKANIEAIIKVEDGWSSHANDYTIFSEFKAESYTKDENKREIRAVYILNGGGDKIYLETVNSNIELKKASK